MLVRGGARCPKHMEQHVAVGTTRNKKEHHAVRAGFKRVDWERVRAEWLRCFPNCVECQARNVLTKATDVDHIHPHNGDPVLFFDRDNLQSLCHACHSRKTAAEDGGFGNAPSL